MNLVVEKTFLQSKCIAKSNIKNYILEYSHLLQLYYDPRSYTRRKSIF